MGETDKNLRRYTFKLYPRPAQAEALDGQRRMHAALYNALLQQRIEAYRRQGVTLGAYDQGAGLRALRHDPEIGAEWTALSSKSMEATAARLDRAMKAFFKRAKQGMGASSGFPKFKRSDDYPGFSMGPHGNGWDVAFRDHPQDRPGNGSLRIKAVPGRIRMRGRLPVSPVKVRTCEMLWRDGDWWLSLVVDMPGKPQRERHSEAEVRFDLVDSFAVVKTASGAYGAGPEETVFAAADGRIVLMDQGDNPDRGHDTPQMGAERRHSSSCSASSWGHDIPEMGRIEALQQAMARCKRGSNRYRKLKMQKARIQARQARQRHDALHRWTSAVVERHSSLTVIAPPSIREATASGSGDARDHGAAVELKAKVNRRVLDQAPALAIAMLEYKAAQVGGHAEIVEDNAAPVLVGNQIVEARKETRRLKKAVKRKESR